MANEQTFFKSADIQITNMRAVIGSRTYPISNITSVGMFEKTPSRVFAVILMVVGVFMIIWSGLSPVSVIGLLIILGGAYLMYTQKVEYIVRIGSASGEVNALASPNAAHIQKIVEALNNAIVTRG